MENYLGFQTVVMSDETLASFYEDINSVILPDCLTNEYLLIENDHGEIVEYLKFNGEGLSRVPYKQIGSRYLGKIKPRNPQQQLAIDMLYNQDTTVKVITGKFGTGKDLLMCGSETI